MQATPDLRSVDMGTVCVLGAEGCLISSAKDTERAADGGANTRGLINWEIK